MTPEEDDYNDCEDEESCHFCGGEGWVHGYDMNEPLLYDSNKAYNCPCCRGSGSAKDCTFW